MVLAIPLPFLDYHPMLQPVTKTTKKKFFSKLVIFWILVIVQLISSVVYFVSHPEIRVENVFIPIPPLWGIYAARSVVPMQFFALFFLGMPIDVCIGVSFISNIQKPGFGFTNGKIHHPANVPEQMRVPTALGKNANGSRLHGGPPEEEESERELELTKASEGKDHDDQAAATTAGSSLAAVNSLSLSERDVGKTESNFEQKQSVKRNVKRLSHLSDSPTTAPKTGEEVDCENDNDNGTSKCREAALMALQREEEEWAAEPNTDDEESLSSGAVSEDLLVAAGYAAGRVGGGSRSRGSRGSGSSSSSRKGGGGNQVSKSFMSEQIRAGWSNAATRLAVTRGTSELEARRRLMESRASELTHRTFKELSLGEKVYLLNRLVYSASGAAYCLLAWYFYRKLGDAATEELRDPLRLLQNNNNDRCASREVSEEAAQASANIQALRDNPIFATPREALQERPLVLPFSGAAQRLGSVEL